MVYIILKILSDESIANRYHSYANTDYGRIKLGYIKPKEDFVSIWKYLTSYKLELNNNINRKDLSEYKMGLIYDSDDGIIDNNFNMYEVEFSLTNTHLTDELLLYLSLKYNVTYTVIDWEKLGRITNEYLG